MLPKVIASQLGTSAQAEVESVLANGGPRTSKPTGEVSAVRTMTLDGFDAIANVWTPILRSHRYRIGLQAVFCHSRPQVSFKRIPSPYAPPPSAGGRGRCELADLLVVIDHTDPSAQVKDRRAVLIQAKLLHAGAIKPSGKEWIQHELLAWRPGFDFMDSGIYEKNSRSRCLAGCRQSRQHRGVWRYRSQRDAGRVEPMADLADKPLLHQPGSFRSVPRRHGSGYAEIWARGDRRRDR